MNKYFTSVQSLEDLKTQFRALAKIHHPDAGGDATIMQEINNEYDRLFPIWKERSGVRSAETAESTRSEFYSENGWKGENYSSRRSLKDVASIVRAYVKEKYPEYKFSVTKDSYNALSVTVKEGPIDLGQWKGETFYRHHNGEGLEYGPFREMINDVNQFVNSYNLEDIDAMTDYFRVGFWFHGVKIAYDYKVNEKRKASAKRAKANRPSNGNGSSNQTSNGNGSADYDIQQTTHTKTGETIWVVKLIQNLSREEYLTEAEKMKALGGYYSKFVHGFVFKADPSDALLGNANAIVA